VYKKQIWELPEQRNKLKRKLIDEYEAKESSSKKRGLQEIVTKRVLRIPLKNLEKIDWFLDFIADIDLSQEFEEKTDLPF
jgi:hypothetical protein